MSQEPHRDVLDGAPDDDPDVMIDRPDATGLLRVDEVIDAVAGVGIGSLPEQVRVYEQAHVALRAALDDPAPGDPAAGPDPA